MTTIAERRRRRKQAAQAERERRAKEPKTAERRVLAAIKAMVRESQARHSVLYRLRHKGAITHPQYEAGVRWQQDEHGSRDAGVTDYTGERVQSSPGVPVGKLEAQVARLVAARAAWEALCKIGASVALDCREVCVHDREPRAIARARLPRRLLSSAANPDELAAALAGLERKIVDSLRVGLDALKKHYGRGKTP